MCARKFFVNPFNKPFEVLFAELRGSNHGEAARGWTSAGGVYTRFGRKGAPSACAYRSHSGSIRLIDIAMPVMNGLEATCRIKSEMPKVRVIGLSMYDDEAIYRCMREAGAETLVSKSDSSSELIDAIYRIGRPVEN
jgi:CheY-like chemotaxis protein